MPSTREGDGAVRIMTVHASKGLEYPVVAVAEALACANRPVRQDGPRRRWAQIVALPLVLMALSFCRRTFVKGAMTSKAV